MNVTHTPVLPLVVAVDGPAGSGKSSVSKEVARRLGFAFLDTGAAYRALAWHAEASGVDTDDAASVVSCLQSFAYRIGTESAVDRLLLAGQPAEARAIAKWNPPRMPIGGGDVIGRGVPEGPEVARTLRRIEDAWEAAGFPTGDAFKRLVDDTLG